MAGVDHELAVDDGVLILEQTALRRAGCARAIFVVGAAVAGAHEEVRLWEPAHRTAKVRAVDGEDLKLIALHMANPARDVGGHAVVRSDDGIAVVDETRLTFGEVADGAKRYPRLELLIALKSRAEQVAKNRDGENRADSPVEYQRKLEEKATARVAVNRSRVRRRDLRLGDGRYRRRLLRHWVAGFVLCAHGFSFVAVPGRAGARRTGGLLGDRRTMGSNPGNDVGDLLRRERVVGNVRAPVRRVIVEVAGDRHSCADSDR